MHNALVTTHSTRDYRAKSSPDIVMSTGEALAVIDGLALILTHDAWRTAAVDVIGHAVPTGDLDGLLGDLLVAEVTA